MILDIPPQTAQMIIATAEQQGVTVNKLLLSIAKQPSGFEFVENDGIVSSYHNHLSNDDLQALYDDLDNDKPNAELQALMQKFGGLGV